MVSASLVEQGRITILSIASWGTSTRIFTVAGALSISSKGRSLSSHSLTSVCYCLDKSQADWVRWDLHVDWVRWDLHVVFLHLHFPDGLSWWTFSTYWPFGLLYWRAYLVILAGEHSYLYTLDWRLVLLYLGKYSFWGWCTWSREGGRGHQPNQPDQSIQPSWSMGDRCHIGSLSLALYLRSVCLFIYSSFYSLGALFALWYLFICLFIYFEFSIFWALVLYWINNWERFLSHPVGCFFTFLTCSAHLSERCNWVHSLL